MKFALGKPVEVRRDNLRANMWVNQGDSQGVSLRAWLWVSLRDNLLFSLRNNLREKLEDNQGERLKERG